MLSLEYTASVVQVVQTEIISIGKQYNLRVSMFVTSDVAGSAAEPVAK